MLRSNLERPKNQTDAYLNIYEILKKEEEQKDLLNSSISTIFKQEINEF